MESYEAPQFKKRTTMFNIDVEESWSRKLIEDNESRKFQYFSRPQHLLDSEKDSDSETKTDDWEKVQDKIREQIILRMCSCVQISSKIISFDDVPQISEFLERAGCPYTHTALCKSEMRILTTLDYHVNISTPISYIEFYIYKITDIVPSLYLLPVYNMAIIAMDIFYLNRTFIVDEMANISTKPKNLGGLSEPHNYYFLWCDYIFVSIACIISAAYLTCNENTDSVSIF
ncbi:hypothetical protein RF11_15237 [Thelohanellus kitauei]|uniref:Uncharacterized protein n=1 Tax=Thelohanellus kitauei TaxID=669202 RepID=A0A0C2MI48_THEKT|nr:hypothetical protein RF11_15237 [Thelohanellus kitauei]